jgi:hypothetical protein
MQLNTTFNQAKSLGVLSGVRTVKQALGPKEKRSYYQFTLTNRSSCSLQLNGFKANIDLELIDRDRQVIGFSRRPGKKAELISQTLESGTYYLRVIRRGKSTKYRLRLNATAAPLPAPLTEDYLSTASGELGKVNKLSGTFTRLNSSSPTLLDLARSNQGELFGISFSSLYKIDPTSGATTLVGNLGRTNLNGLAFSATGILYASGGSELYTLDPSTGATTLVANLPGFESSGDLVFDPVGNRLLATSRFNNNSDTLFSISPSGNATKIGDIGFANVFGLALDNGVLYGYTSDRQQITINPLTGSGTFDRTLTGTANAVYGST